MIRRDFHPVADIFPLMQGEEFDRLVADIREHDLREPIWLHQDGRIIDGRNRYRACPIANREPRFQTYIGPDESLVGFVISMNLHRRHLNESQRAMAATRTANLPQGARTDLPQICGKSQSEAAAAFNVSSRSVQTAQKVKEKGVPGLIKLVDDGVVAVSDAVRVVGLPIAEQDRVIERLTTGQAKTLARAHRDAEIERQRREIAEGTAKQPDGVFEVIAMDPPWPYGNQHDYDREYFRATTPYPEMSLEEIATLKIPAADNCVLWLWTTHRFLPHAFPLIESWGFEYRVTATWAKDRFGVGRWLRSQSEFCLLATRGHPRVELKSQSTVIHGAMRQHSRKPDEFYELVESLCIGRKLDYFSREPRPGWEQFGNDLAKFGGAA